MGLAIISAITVFLVMWSISIRRRLAGMDEHINSAMNQIGIQLAAQYDALAALVDVAKCYDARKGQFLNTILKSGCYTITAFSQPEEVRLQEEVITEVLEGIAGMVECYPELKMNEAYAARMNAVDGYGKMVCTSRLIYNDSVDKLNRELRIFPTSLLACMLGFRRRSYMEEAGADGGKVRGVLEYSAK